MNKQEAIEQLEWDVVRTTDFDRAEYVVVFEKVKSIISQIPEPQNVVVPKVVAEWYDHAKQQNFTLRSALEHWSMSEELEKWFQYSYNQETFAQAWLFGYEVEKEQLYTVEIPNNGGTLILACINHAIKLVDGNKHLPGKFTKESIEYAGFDWALKWAKPAEVE
ncbi:DUF1642 domain-containing protein [Streptococcus suis]|uniref:DUF1642 domain-containing protein n=1 Tax=Streptococcus suis TaxID=1307 RepID=UPI00209B8BC3|nr:DUF1642 domain-containing protein [Streptococcus suis]MCO8241116.1 DUF1642 domain-containing protein [Streptococcus suis]